MAVIFISHGGKINFFENDISTSELNSKKKKQ